MSNLDGDINHVISLATTLSTGTGVPVYLVGGFVRDLILGRPVEDIDFVVEGDAIEFAHLFKKKFGGTRVVSYGRFGTAMLNFRQFKLEFVSAREEYYENHSRKPIVHSAHIKSDLSRRDFTINAMAIKLGEADPHLIDPFNGLEDLKNGIIRTPLEPSITFYDDPLRILRAVRFASRYNYQIESHTYDGIIRNAERLKIVSGERITDELMRMFTADEPIHAYRYLKDCQLFTYTFPEFEEHLSEASWINPAHSWDEMLESCLRGGQHNKFKWEEILILMHAWLVESQPALFHLDQKTVIFGKRINFFRTIGQRLKLSNEMTAFVSHGIMFLPFYIKVLSKKNKDFEAFVHKLLYYGKGYAPSLFKLAALVLSAGKKIDKNEIKEKTERFEEAFEADLAESKWINFRPRVSGEDIMQWVPAANGIRIGKIKNRISAAILDREIENNEKEIENWIKRHYVK